MTAFIQLRLRTKNQTWRGFFFLLLRLLFCRRQGFFFFFFRDTTEDPMVLKANTSVSVCDTGLHFTEDTNRVFSPPNQAPRRQPSPNQLTSEPSATTWGGPRVTVSRLKDNVHHAPLPTDAFMSVGICLL